MKPTKQAKVNLTLGLYHRVSMLAQDRRQPLSTVIRGALDDYFRIREGTAIDLSDVGELGKQQRSPLLAALANTETRIAKSLQAVTRENEDLRLRLARIETMLDHGMLSLLCHLPEVAPERTAAAIESGQRRHRKWQAAVQEGGKHGHK